MAAPARPADGSHNDGGLVFGSQEVTVATKVYIAKNIKINRPFNLLESKDAKGQAYKEAMIPQNLNGTMETSPIDEDTEAPPFGEKFELIPLGGGDAIVCKVAQSDEAQDQNAEGVYSVTWRRYINPPA